MISTVDFITPPVDDPYWFGQISAANSISDVYSMGGKPLTALNVVMFPSKHLDMGVLKEILRGGHDKVMEADACLVGGHTVDDEEPKYGLSVNGVIHPDHILTNAGSKPGDALILTKPLGTGVLFNAVRSGKLKLADIETDVLPTVASLNGAAMEAARNFPLHACTDITGFGIAGHALEIARGSGTTVVLSYKDLPFYPMALDMYEKGETTGSNLPNRTMTHGALEIKTELSRAEQELLFDPQTSGGLLFSVPEAAVEAVLRAIAEAGVDTAACIGRIVEGEPAVQVT
jgi:selenide,water dikinase